MRPQAKIAISLLSFTVLVIASVILFIKYGVLVPDLVPWIDHNAQFQDLNRGQYYTWVTAIAADCVYVLLFASGLNQLYPNKLPLWLVLLILSTDILGENLIVYLSLNAQELVVGHNWILSTISTVKWMGVLYAAYRLLKRYPKF